MNINATDNFTIISLPTVTFGRILKIFGGQVQISAAVKLSDTSSVTTRQTSFFVVSANSIYLNSTALIQAGYILLQADSAVQT
jgi:hypothetical protein